jgi:type IX secretion system PorP/SprF family membrane protein
LKKTIFIFLLFSFFPVWWKGAAAFAQQLPYYTQYKSNDFMLNPAITGTKRLIDARLNYRMQWVGYTDAPRTESFSLHSRFMKGTMGAGLYVMADQVGPSKQTNIGLSYAYHIRFPDCELSVGVAGNYTNYTLIGDKITLHNSQDPAIDQYITNSTWVPDASAGIYLYNDRFHLGLSALHILESTAELYKADTTKKGLIRYATNVNFSMGYNYSQNHDYIWESTLYGNYTIGAPFIFDYTLRIHYKEKMFAGASVRLNDALALHVGATFMEYFQVSYSYDFLIGKLKSYSSGSHEIMLVFSSDLSKNKHNKNDKFLRQKYQYLF